MSFVILIILECTWTLVYGDVQQLHEDENEIITMNLWKLGSTSYSFWKLLMYCQDRILLCYFHIFRQLFSAFKHQSMYWIAYLFVYILKLILRIIYQKIILFNIIIYFLNCITSYVNCEYKLTHNTMRICIGWDYLLIQLISFRKYTSPFHSECYNWSLNYWSNFAFNYKIISYWI